MTRVAAQVCGAVGALLALSSIFVLSWAHYGDYAIPLSRFTGWPVHAASALGLQAAVAWVWTQGRLRGIALRAGIVCGLLAAASAIMLGLRFDNAGDFFNDIVPLVMPSPGLGPFAAALAVLFSLFSLSVGAVQRDSTPHSATPLSPAPS